MQAPEEEVHDPSPAPSFEAAEEDALEQEDADGEEYDEEDEEEGYEFDDAADAAQCVEMAERGPAAGGAGPTVNIRDFEALAALSRKRAFPDDHPPWDSSSTKKRRQQQGELSEEAESADLFDQLMEGFGLRRKKRRKSKDGKRRGRTKGKRNKCSPEVIKKLGDATLLFTENRFREAIPILHEIVRIAPNLPNAYNLLGSIYRETGETHKAINFVWVAANVAPKDAALWRKLVDLALKVEDAALARHCVIKAMRADPEDVGLKYDCANIYRTLRDYHKAAEVYEQIVRIYPSNAVARRTAAQMYRDSGQIDKAIDLLEEFVNAQTTNVDWSLLDLLVSLYLRNNNHGEALRQINRAHLVLGSQHKLPVRLQAKAVICQAYVGNMEPAEVFLQDVQLERSKENADLVAEVASTLENLGKYDYAMRFYSMVEDVAVDHDGSSYVKVARCYIVMGEKTKAIAYLYKALDKMKDSVDVRITLSSLLADEDRSDDAISVLSPPENPELQSASIPNKQKPWWLDGEVKMQLAKLYYSKGKMQEFVDTIFLPILETLDIENANRKVKVTKKLTNDVLQERTKVLGEVRPDSVFQGCRPIASPAELLKANRAKKLLEKRAASNDGDMVKHDKRRAKQIPPLPGLLTNMENHQLVLDLCRTLTLLQQYFEALQIINHALKFGNDPFSDDNKEELRSLGAEIAYRAPDPRPGFDYVRYLVQKHPHSVSAWNFYYKVTSRDEKRQSKFLLRARRYPNCVPPKIISGNQFTEIKQHQSATRDYLEAYKLDPENPFINLCVGSSLVNLSLGFRLQNKNQCIVQAFAFLYQCLRIGSNRQEALYNIARAYHHVGLKTLAVIYYEKVLAMEVKDEPIPKRPFEEDAQQQQDLRPGYCDLRREAAFNLHLIYKESGATDLARRILKTYCSF
ncbi:uncharacterized protein [Lolium perenne]|uniref:uncharacterized protein n=1 Tax=Lolium perenne TaxID=4522 RepID=UPI0021F5B64F|nr:uncharacterized protein LOC127292905 [Lolium perenne]